MNPILSQFVHLMPAGPDIVFEKGTSPILSSALDFSGFTNATSITIGDDSFNYIWFLYISNLNKLMKLTIGKHCFTMHSVDSLLTERVDWSTLNISYKGLVIANCSRLTEINIGEYSFAESSGGFVLYSR